MTSTSGLQYTSVGGQYEDLLKKYFVNEFQRGFVRCGTGGTVMPVHFKGIADEILNLEIRDDDIFVCSFPKSGTTWTQEMIWCIVNNLDFDGAKVLLAKRSPFLEVSGIPDPEKTKDPKYNLPRFVWDSVGVVKGLPSPRIIKTHLPYHMLPLQLQRGQTGAKIVYVMRDVKDVILSLHHHCQLQGLCRADFDSFATLFINDAITWTPYWENILSYLKREDDKKILFLRYEDMKKDLSSEVKRVAEFLGKQLTAEQVETLCKHLSFDNMKSNPAVNFEERREIVKKLTEKEMNGNVMRQGQAGGWKKKLSPEWVIRIDQWTDNRLQGIGSSFINRLNVQ